MATINGHYITVEEENPDYPVEVTEQPVEDNVNLSDHVQRKPVTMAISGVVVGEDAAQIREHLIYAKDNASIVEYDGRNYFVGLITSLATTHDHKIANGYRFTMTLKEIRIAEASYTDTLPAPVKAQAAPVISSGRKQTKSKSKTKDKEATKAADLSFWE